MNSTACNKGIPVKSVIPIFDPNSETFSLIYALVLGKLIYCGPRLWQTRLDSEKLQEEIFPA